MANRHLFRAERLLWRFQRSGGFGVLTKAFSDLPEHARACLTSLTEFRESEVPLVACFRDMHNWVVLTTDRLAWADASGVRSVAVRDVWDARPSEECMSRLRENWEAKLAWDHLLVTCRDASRFELWLEPGRPFFGFLNVLRVVAQRNRGRGDRNEDGRLEPEGG